MPATSTSAIKALVEAGREPHYIVGGSMGAILGGIMARKRPIPMDDYIEFAYSLTYRGLLGPEPRTRRHGLVSLFSLRYAEFDVVDAQSFSAAIPGVLHHETRSTRMVPLIDRWMADKKVAALVDGVAASNVPVELAWRRLREGRIGTRNGVVLALDCFHPQWDPKHLWLTPITRAVQVQMVRNAPYADQLVRMTPTLSVTNLAPNRERLDQAVAWGEASMAGVLPLLDALLEPVWWDGAAPSYADRRTLAERVSQAPSMKPIVEASRRQRERWRQVRDRMFT